MKHWEMLAVTRSAALKKSDQKSELLKKSESLTKI